jgi:hypothetical protein
VTPEEVQNANTRLAGHFLELSPQTREKIARTLGLLPDNYSELGRLELAKQIFILARQNQLLARLWDAVEERHPQGQLQPNPFTT